MRLRRQPWLAWLALALNALAPVVAYAHIGHDVVGDLVYCPADVVVDHGAHHGAGDERHGDAHEHDAGSVDGGTGSTSNAKHGVTPHCQYCPGFSAGAPLSAGIAAAPVPPQAVADAAAGHYWAPVGRASIRIPQQRAPPSVS